MTARYDNASPEARALLEHHDEFDLAEKLVAAQAELAQLRAGEEPGYDPLSVPTPGQWIARWNQASPAERLDVAGRIIENQAQAARCFEMNHEARLADERNAKAAVARVRALVAGRWGVVDPDLVRAALDEPAPGPAATQATESRCTGCGHHEGEGCGCPPASRTDRLAAALAEALRAFVPVSSHNGVRIGWTAPHPIHPDDYDRWNAALKEQS
ncbi:hypothetical protein [Streptomyces sp. NPDC029554]|uniref:hypothetical protein n=1 Tax=Streptomyces sp. NPDC029554 TaxID=3155126 RepID=UPI0033DAA387